MTTAIGVLDLPFEAAEDLSDDQYSFVVLTSTGKVRRPDNETEALLGILQNAPESGKAAAVRIIGTSKLTANDALTIDTFVKAEYVSATDAGKAKSATAALAYARAQVISPSDAEDEFCEVLLIGQVPGITALADKTTTVTSKTTAGAVTYAAAEIISSGGRGTAMILRDPAGASRSDVTPIASAIVAAVTGCTTGSSFEFVIRNAADANETIKLTAGASVTLSGTMTIGQNATRRFLAVVTNAAAGTEAVTIYDLGLAVQDESTVTTDTTVGARTYTAAEFVGISGTNLILRDPNGGDRSDVTPIAAAIVAAIPGAKAGSSRELVIRNDANAAETITITAGDAGVTLSGTMTIAQNNAKRFKIVVTNAGAGTEAVTVYSLGTVVF